MRSGFKFAAVLAAILIFEPVSWSAPSADSVTFVESSKSLGVAESTEVWGLSTVDWNGDFCDDLYVGRHSKLFPRLYRNGCPGRFSDDVQKLRLDLLPWRWTKDRHGLAFGDFDGDGRMDLFIATGGGGGTGSGNDDQLFHQLANGTFENIAPQQNMNDRLGSGRDSHWFDYDLDGDLDLFLGHFSQPERPLENRNILWRNTAGNFDNAAAQAGVNTVESSISNAVADLDGDGDLDLITTPGEKVSVYLSQGNGTFTRSTLGFGQVATVAVGDYDGDGDGDLFLARSNPNSGPLSTLLRNDSGTWTNVGAAAGVQYPYAQTALWIDADNDGNLDLFVTRGVDGTGANAPDLLLINQGDGSFVDVAPAAGVTGCVDGGQDVAAWGDFDRDGFVDLAVVCSKSVEAVRVYLNGGNANRWITVHLLDPSSKNRQAIGAKIRATTGTRTQYRQLVGDTAFRSQSALYVHFGLGAALTVDSLRIRWPDGTQNTFTNVQSNVHYLATKGGGLTPLP